MCNVISVFEHTDLWAGAAGVLLGAMVPYLIERHRRTVERAGEIVAIGVEFKRALELMTALRTPGEDGKIVLAPLYRLPTAIADRAVPKLIGEGLLRPEEIAALLDYLERIEELNRGLERARHAPGIEATAIEYDRNVGKVRHVLDEPVRDRATRYELAVAAIARVQQDNPPPRV